MDVVIRAALMYCFLLFITRVVGRRELSTLEPFDLILLIVLGDLIQQGVTQSDYSFTGLMLAAGTIAIMQTSVSWIGYRSPKKAGLVLEGEPIVIVQDGKCLERNTKRERIRKEEVLESARKNGIGSLDEIEWGILETSGEMTFIKKSD
jgi:uncharacterized membrane protein YcaP (DUF421 family)